MASSDYYVGTYPQEGYRGASPFNRISNAYLPSTREEEIKAARFTYRESGITQLIIQRLASFPLTELEHTVLEKDIQIGSPSFDSVDKIRASYAHMHDDILQTRGFSRLINTDLYTFGAALPMINCVTRIRLICPHCQEKVKSYKGVLLNEIDEQSWSYDCTAAQFRGKCTNCNRGDVVFTAVEEFVPGENAFRLVLIPPEQVKMEVAEFSQQRRFYYRPSDALKRKVRDGNKWQIMNLPIMILKAVSQNKAIILNMDLLHPFLMPCPTDPDRAWPAPTIFRAFHNIFYINALRGASEAIAVQHIKPMIVMFPKLENNEGILKSSVMFSKFKDFVKQEYVKWAKTPTHVMVSPIPVGYDRIGGDGRMLLPTGETQAATQEMSLSMGMPMGLLDGAAPWAGNAVSLRILETDTQNVRNDHHVFYDKINTLIHRVLKWPKAVTRMKDMKLLDDTIIKQLMVNLLQLGATSKQQVLKLFGLDQKAVFEEQSAEKKAEMERDVELNKEFSIKSVEVQAEMQAAYSRVMAQSQYELQESATKNTIAQVEQYVNAGFSIQQAIQMVSSQAQAAAQMQAAMAAKAQADQAKQLYIMRETANAQASLNRGSKERATLNMMSPTGFMAGLDSLPDNVRQAIMDSLSMIPVNAPGAGEIGGLVAGPVEPLPDKGQPPRREGSR